MDRILAAVLIGIIVGMFPVAVSTGVYLIKDYETTKDKRRNALIRKQQCIRKLREKYPDYL